MEIWNPLMNNQTDSEEEKSLLDLPDHLLVHIFTFFDFETVMVSRILCKRLNELVLSESKIAKRIKLIYVDFDERSKSLQESSSRYRNLTIYDSSGSSEEQLLRFLKVKGEFFKEITFEDTKPNLVHTLPLCGNLEALYIKGSCKDHDLLSNLCEKVLNSSRTFAKLKTLGLHPSVVPHIKMFNNVCGLEKLKVFFVFGGETQTEKSVDELEEFLLKQCNLKILEIETTLHRGLFPAHRLKDVKFQLESFTAYSPIIDENSIKEFFRLQQSSLETVKIKDFFDAQKFLNERIKYQDIFREILKLPRLKNLEILNVTEADNLRAVCTITSVENKSLEYLCYDREFQDPVAVLSSFPNLKKITFGRASSLHAERVANEYGGFDFIFRVDFPTELLRIIELRESFCFTYKPTVLPSDPQRASDDLLEFFKRHNRKRQITSIFIGDPSWVDKDFKLPTTFWGDALRILRLGQVKIAGPSPPQGFFREWRLIKS